jgi:hypothetical protein
MRDKNRKEKEEKYLPVLAAQKQAQDQPNNTRPV